MSEPMRRILIIGSGGAGKSTLARSLGERLGLPVVHLDCVYWRPGWVESPPEEFDRALEALLAQGPWIMDGNYGRTLSRRLTAADTVIFLDLPRAVCVWRVVLRAVRYRGRTRPDMGAACPEKWPDSEFLRWTWTYPRCQRPGVLAMLDENSQNKNVFRLMSARDVLRFLQSVPGPAGSAPPIGS